MTCFLHLLGQLIWLIEKCVLQGKFYVCICGSPHVVNSKQMMEHIASITSTNFTKRRRCVVFDSVLSLTSGAPALPAKAHPNQFFMIITMESPYSPFGAQSYMSQFQLTYTYRLDSDVRATYIPIGLASYNEVRQ